MMELCLAFLILLSSVMPGLSLMDTQSKNPGCDPEIHTCDFQ